MSGDETVQEVDHTIPRGAMCYGVDATENYAYLCITCHREKTQLDHQMMNVEDPNVYMSRFNQETWDGFVMARKPSQNVCNLHEQIEGPPCLEIDVKSCRLNGLTEGNVHDVCVFSPLDELKKSGGGSHRRLQLG